MTENEAVPQAYLDKNIPIAYHQLVKGGYRLYYTMTYIFGDSSNDSYETTMHDFSNMVIDAMT